MSAREGRTYIVALCGGGDRPIATLGGRTPFEAAPTPNLDELTRAGALGLLTVIAPDIPPESDSGAMALLGYDPLTHYTGRGPLEGHGMDFWDGAGASVAFRVNFASRDPRTGRLDRRTSRDLADAEQQALAQELREGIRLADLPLISFQLTAFGRHRGIVCFTSRAVPLSGNVANTDPGFRKQGAFGVPNASFTPAPLPCEPLENTEAARNTAAAVNAFVAESAVILSASAVNRARVAAGRLPANILLFRDSGDTLPVLPDFAKQTGMRMALYGQVPAERGLCKLFGGRFITSKATAAESDRAFYTRLVAEVAADPADLVFVHLKGPDEPGHDDRPEEKTEAIAGIDAFFVRQLVDRLGPNDRLVVTCDHATPCELGIHAPDPVPTVLFGPGIEANGATAFSETQAARRALPFARAHDLMPYMARLGALR